MSNGGSPCARLFRSRRPVRASLIPSSSAHRSRTMWRMKSHSLTIRLEADMERELEAVYVETGRSRGDIMCEALGR